MALAAEATARVIHIISRSGSVTRVDGGAMVTFSPLAKVTRAVSRFCTERVKTRSRVLAGTAPVCCRAGAVGDA
jgi:hypothetical protein